MSDKPSQAKPASLSVTAPAAAGSAAASVPLAPLQPNLPSARQSNTAGKLADNIMYFARVLRAAGLPIGPARVLDALTAVNAVGLRRREDLYWTLHALFISHPRQRELYDQAFQLFWRNPKLLEQMMGAFLAELETPHTEEEKQAVSQRVAEALFPNHKPKPNDELRPEVQMQASLTWSDQEKLMQMDFNSMSGEEMRQAQMVISRVKLALKPIRVRRYQAKCDGRRIDRRASLQASLKAPDIMPLQRCQQRSRAPALVTLCDISGSMSQYSRMILHFMHAVTSARDSVHSFVFGTRLTNITRQLRYRDVDVALQQVSAQVNDWNGGTRMGQCLETFNRQWSRRVLSQGAIVILISDGLDRDAGDGLAAQMKRLAHSCRRLVWLNPLLRYSGYQPKTMGSRAILPWVDDFRSIHNLQSMVQLADALSAVDNRNTGEMKHWQASLRAVSANGASNAASNAAGNTNQAALSPSE